MNRPVPDAASSTAGPLVSRVALGLLILATVAGAIVYPTYPNYDSYYSLLWGRELLHLTTPSFETYYAPTQHPLAVAFGALLSLLGRGGDRVMVLCTLASFVLLVVGIYHLGRLLFTRWVGLAAGVILCTRLDFPFLAARAYIDIPYLALVVWAVVLEVRADPGRPRGGPVWGLLICAGLLRPEAWLLLGCYGLWVAWCRYREERRAGPALATLARAAAISAIAPGIWMLTDWLVTGDPMFSLTHTSSFAEELGRTKGASQIPHAMQVFFMNLTKAPVLAAGVLGAGLAFWFVPRRAVLPAVLWLIGSGTFVLVGLAGLSVIDRYLLVPALMVMVFAAVTLAGWTMLRPSLLRRIWAGVAVAMVLYGAVFTVLRVNPNALTSELSRRGASHRALVALLDSAPLNDACRPYTVPNHKLVPEVRWVAGLGEPDVRARAEATGGTPAARREAARLRGDGTAIYVVERGTVLKQAVVSDRDDVFNNVPVYINRREVPGYDWLTANHYYAAYGRCAAR